MILIGCLGHKVAIIVGPLRGLICVLGWCQHCLGCWLILLGSGGTFDAVPGGVGSWVWVGHALDFVREVLLEGTLQPHLLFLPDEPLHVLILLLLGVPRLITPSLELIYCLKELVHWLQDTFFFVGASGDVNLGSAHGAVRFWVYFLNALLHRRLVHRVEVSPIHFCNLHHLVFKICFLKELVELKTLALFT